MIEVSQAQALGLAQAVFGATTIGVDSNGDEVSALLNPQATSAFLALFPETPSIDSLWPGRPDESTLPIANREKIIADRRKFARRLIAWGLAIGGLNSPSIIEHIDGQAARVCEYLRAIHRNGQAVPATDLESTIGQLVALVHGISLDCNPTAPEIGDPAEKRVSSIEQDAIRYRALRSAIAGRHTEPGATGSGIYSKALQIVEPITIASEDPTAAEIDRAIDEQLLPKPDPEPAPAVQPRDPLSLSNSDLQA